MFIQKDNKFVYCTLIVLLAQEKVIAFSGSVFDSIGIQYLTLVYNIIVSE